MAEEFDVPWRHVAWGREEKDKLLQEIKNLKPTNQVSLLTGGIVDKIKTVKSEVTDLGVPQVVLLTKVDLACPVVKDDLKNVYKSKYIKELMEKCSQIIGIPANCILPVKNYHEETTLNDDVDVDLILTALLQILRFADDYFENLCC
nr:PREDICTED: LOW QUALITY PROTEIN: interferon-induced protein 44-like [Lepisosteus oculatus]